MKFGDCNSKFFHATIKKSDARKKISALKKDDDTWSYDLEELKNLLSDYYLQLYSDPTSYSNFFLPPICQSWQLTPTEREDLDREVSLEEVKAALFDMNPNKSPGIDGFPTVFFQKSWNLVGTNLLSLVREALREGKIDPDLNRTLIVLIPKVQGPERISQFRPISLCMLPLKIITKLLVDRLRPRLISKSQSSFVHGRHTTDNIIIVQEALHTMRKMKRKSGIVAIKVDLEKAYDRIRWSFLQQVLEEVGLPLSWI